MTTTSGYGLWGLVLLETTIFIVFAFSFTHPKTKRDWRSFGAFSAFIVALFTEMYGFPLTIYFFSGTLIKYFPNVDWLSHNNGHLWETLLGLKGDPHFNIIHTLSSVFIIIGFIIIAKAWQVLYKAQKEHTLAVNGIYKYTRHPQYVGFIMIMVGFLLQWPTILTLAMFPILVFMYTRLSYKEEREMEKEFGEEYIKYKEKVPAFIPNFKEKNIWNH
ncbi:MAG: isoprenylcysteine carboxylmethyltransferase family protein [Candidatus Paceibacterota bacterium]